MQLRPRINDPILLTDSDDRSYRSRVESTAPGLLTVAQPLDLPASHGLRAGSEIWASWTDARGVAVLPTRLVKSSAEGSVRLWVLETSGDGWIQQRRHYVRVRVSGPVTLRAVDTDAAGMPVSGQLVDLSEASLQCSVDIGSASPPDEGIEVTAQFRLADHDLEIPGRLHEARPDQQSYSRMAMVVVFDQPVLQADALRRLIFAQQLRERAVRPD